MLTAQEFWRWVDDDAGDSATLHILVLTSWRRSANLCGPRGADIASVNFNQLSRLALPTAIMSRLDTTTLAAYVSEASAHDELSRWFPAVVRLPDLEVEIVVETTTFERSAEDTAEELYGRAQRFVKATWESIPADDRYRGKSVDWHEAVGVG